MPPLFKCFYAEGNNDGEKGGKKNHSAPSVCFAHKYETPPMSHFEDDIWKCEKKKKLIDIPFPSNVTHA